MPRREQNRVPGEGSIYQEGDGWRAALPIEGRIVRRRAKTEREARRKLRELEKLREQRLQVGTGKMLLREWLDRWFALLTEQVKPATAQGHKETCNRYVTPFLGHLRLDAIRASHLDEWRATLRAKGLSDGTIATAHRRLNTALNVAVRRKMIAENPLDQLDPITIDAAEVTTLDAPQVATLLDLLASHRLYALFAATAALGLRSAEIIGLRWSAVTLTGDAPRLTVAEQLQQLKDAEGKRYLHREKSAKTKAGERTIPLSPELVSIMQAHRTRMKAERVMRGERPAEPAPDDLVFVSERGTPLNGRNVLRTLHRACKRAELPRVSFHSLRHSAGSIMLANGAQIVDVSKILGHASPIVTANRYAHSFDAGKQQAVNAASVALFKRA